MSWGNPTPEELSIKHACLFCLAVGFSLGLTVGLVYSNHKRNEKVNIELYKALEKMIEAKR